MKQMKILSWSFQVTVLGNISIEECSSFGDPHYIGLHPPGLPARLVSSFVQRRLVMHPS